MGYIILGIIVAIILIILIIYNNLVKLRQTVKNAWSRIDVQLQRRFDLIPNLIESVQGYMEHEQEMFTRISEIRTSWANATSLNEKAELDTQLSNSLKTIMAVSENYPVLKASENFSKSQEELRATENKIAASRQFYNDSVTRYNIKLEIIPSNIIASLFNFTPEELFEAESDEARKNINVNF